MQCWHPCGSSCTPSPAASATSAVLRRTRRLRRLWRLRRPAGTAAKGSCNPQAHDHHGRIRCCRHCRKSDHSGSTAPSSAAISAILVVLRQTWRLRWMGWSARVADGHRCVLQDRHGRIWGCYCCGRVISSRNMPVTLLWCSYCAGAALADPVLQQLAGTMAKCDYGRKDICGNNGRRPQVRGQGGKARGSRPHPRCYCWLVGGVASCVTVG